MAELCEAAHLEAPDLLEMLYCTTYRTEENDRIILYRQFLTALEDAQEPARERSIFKVQENLRSMEFRLEKRMNVLLPWLRISEEELNLYPPLGFTFIFVYIKPKRILNISFL